MRLRPIFLTSIVLSLLLVACSTSPKNDSAKNTSGAAPETTSTGQTTAKPATNPTATPNAKPVVPNAEESAPPASAPEGTLLALPFPLPPEPARPTEPAQGSEAQAEFYTQAEQFLGTNDMDFAVLHLLSLAETPENSQEKLIGLLLLSEIYRLEGKSKKALEILTENEFKYPPIPEYYITIADIHESMGNMAGARKALERAVHSSPQNLNLIARLTHLLIRGKDPEMAAKVFAFYEVARPQILAVMELPQVPPEDLIHLIANVNEFQDAKVAETLTRMLEHTNPEVALNALQALLQTGAVSAAPDLRKLSENTENPEMKRVFNQAADMLETFTEKDLGSLLKMPPT